MESVRRFVIQEHTIAGQVHWDLMLEVGRVLQTYRLELPPEKLLQQPSAAVRIFDHPLRFLAYEGSINNGRGSVEIAEAGTYQILGESQDRQELQLDGRILKGKFALTQIENDRWEFGRCQNLQPKD